MANSPSRELRKKIVRNDLTEIGQDVLLDERKRYSKNRGIAPQDRSSLMETDEGREFVSRLLMETLEAYKMPKVTSDEEFAQRLDDYFTRCATRNILPTMEEMFLYCGLDMWWFRDLDGGKIRGFSPNTAKIAKKARSFMQSYDTKLAAEGKLNFLVYCFRSKNYYGMQDKVEYTVSTGSDQQDEYSVDEIRKRYLGSAANDHLDAE